MRSTFVAICATLYGLLFIIPSWTDAPEWPTGLTIWDSDPFTQNLDKAARSSELSTIVRAKLPSLQHAYEKAPKLLQRYLEGSPAWRVEVRNGGYWEAWRRIEVGTQWKFGPGYGKYDIYLNPERKLKTDFRVFVGINLQGNTFMPTPCTGLIFGERIKLEVDAESTSMPYPFNQGPPYYSSCVTIKQVNLVVKVNQFSYKPARIFTNLTIEALEEEFESLAAVLSNNKSLESFVDSLGYNQRPGLALRKARFGSGMYSTQAYVNPGEPGAVYLKAFEIPTNRPLWVDELGARKERTGWSKNPEMTFYANDFFPRISEENGLNVRLEVWFIPDSGLPERKLIENQFEMMQSIF